VVLYRSSLPAVKIPACYDYPDQAVRRQKNFKKLNVFLTRVRHPSGKEEKREYQRVALLRLQRYFPIERGANPLPQVSTPSFSTASKDGSYSGLRGHLGRKSGWTQQHRFKHILQRAKHDFDSRPPHASSARSAYSQYFVREFFVRCQVP